MNDGLRSPGVAAWNCPLSDEKSRFDGPFPMLAGQPAIEFRAGGSVGPKTPFIGQPKWEARLAIVERNAGMRNARKASRPQATAKIGTR